MLREPGRQDLPAIVEAAELLAGRAGHPVPGERELGSTDWSADYRGATDAHDLVQAVVAGIREFLNADVAFIGEFLDGRRVFRWTEALDAGCPVQPGVSEPLEDSWCAKVADGRLPELIPDASVFPSLVDALPAEVPIGTHLSVPITFSDGRVFGTFCVFTHVPDPTLRERDLATLRLLAGFLGRHLERVTTAEAQHAADAASIRAVLAENQLRIVFQPVLHLASGRIAGYEALSRFPTGAPDAWFSRAGRVGLGVALELSAVAAAVDRMVDVPPDAYLAVNVSAATLCSQEFRHLLERWPADRLVVELTEQTAVESYDGLLEAVADLRRRGGRLALDDAGSGYAGLQRILALAPEVLKLDLALVRGIHADPARQALTTALRWFAARTGAAVVAEGIECQQELDMLSSLGVRYGQGYHLGRPGDLPALTPGVLNARP